jgi:hypothetical protein
MAIITIFSAPATLRREMYGDNVLQFVEEILFSYARHAPIEVAQEGKAAAEEAFVLTNNPSRQSEREQTYGRGPSVSVGDVVDVDGVRFLCLPFGWTDITSDVSSNKV